MMTTAITANSIATITLLNRADSWTPITSNDKWPINA
jgi:hypothetical protein